MPVIHWTEQAINHKIANLIQVSYQKEIRQTLLIHQKNYLKNLIALISTLLNAVILFPSNNFLSWKEFGPIEQSWQQTNPDKIIRKYNITLASIAHFILFDSKNLWFM